MSRLHIIAVQPARLWRFLGIFQSPGLRLLHALVAVFCILQFFSSIFMQVGDVKASASAWLHMWGGASLCLLGLLQIYVSLSKRGLRHFYPYLWGDNEQLMHDIRQSLQFKLVGPRPKGLGAVVQGLGLGALFITAFSGLLWFCLWQADAASAASVRQAHDALSWLILLYVLGHGSMALLHFVVWEEHSKQPD